MGLGLLVTLVWLPRKPSSRATVHLEGQVAQNDRQPYPKVAPQHSDKAARATHFPDNFLESTVHLASSDRKRSLPPSRIWGRGCAVVVI